MAEYRKDLKKIYIAMVLDGLLVAAANLVMPLLRDYYGLSYDFGGLLLSVLAVGNLIATFSIGILSRRIGIRLTALILTAGFLLGYSILAVSTVPLMFLLGFFIIGIGKGSSTNHSMVLSSMRSPDRTGNVNLVNALFSFGALTAPMIFILAESFGDFRTPVVLMVLFGFILWLQFVFIKDHGQRGISGTVRDFDFMREPHFWFSTMFLFFEQCSEISVTGWLVTYFKDAGILSGTLSELTVTVYWLATLLARLFITFILPQGSRFRSLIFFSFASLISYFLLLSAKGSMSALIFLFIFGLCIAGTYPTAVAQAGRTLSNMSTGTLLAIGSLGAIIMPYVVGAVAERTNIEGGMFTILFTIFLMLVSAFLIKLSERRT